MNGLKITRSDLEERYPGIPLVRKVWMERDFGTFDFVTVPFVPTHRVLVRLPPKGEILMDYVVFASSAHRASLLEGFSPNAEQGPDYLWEGGDLWNARNPTPEWRKARLWATEVGFGESPSTPPLQGFVYFIGSTRGGPVKIGFSVAPRRRLGELQTASPVRLEILGLLAGTRETEQELHEKFSAHRMSGEWFSPCVEITDFIRDQTVALP